MLASEHLDHSLLTRQSDLCGGLNSLRLFLSGQFFGLIVLVHLWISLLKLPNRWEIISRLTYSFSFL